MWNELGAENRTVDPSSQRHLELTMPVSLPVNFRARTQVWSFWGNSSFSMSGLHGLLRLQGFCHHSHGCPELNPATAAESTKHDFRRCCSLISFKFPARRPLRRLRARRRSTNATVEAIESRILLSATAPTSAEDENDGNGAVANTSPDAVSAADNGSYDDYSLYASQMSDEHESYVDAYQYDLDTAVDSFVTDTGSLGSDPDYGAVIESSPIGDLVEPFDAELENASEQSDQHLNGVTDQVSTTQQSADDALSQNAESSLPGTVDIESTSIFDDGVSIGSYSGSLIDTSGYSDSGSSSSGSESSSSGSSEGSSDTGNDATSGESGTESSETDEEIDDSEPPTPTDPRLAWEPFVLPDDVAFADTPLPAQASLDNLFELTPTGHASISNNSDTTSEARVTATDPELG